MLEIKKIRVLDISKISEDVGKYFKDGGEYSAVYKDGELNTIFDEGWFKWGAYCFEEGAFEVIQDKKADVGEALPPGRIEIGRDNFPLEKLFALSTQFTVDDIIKLKDAGLV